MMMTRNNLLARGALLLASVLFLQACASVVRNPLPEEYHKDVTVLERDDLRHWGDGRRPEVFDGIESMEALEEAYGGIMDQPHNYLVISGGEDSEKLAEGARHCALRDLVGESLGARGALGAALASLAFAAGTTPAGEALPAQGGTILITDFEPGANHVCLTVRASGEGA